MSKRCIISDELQSERPCRSPMQSAYKVEINMVTGVSVRFQEKSTAKEEPNKGDTLLLPLKPNHFLTGDAHYRTHRVIVTKDIASNSGVGPSRRPLRQVNLIYVYQSFAGRREYSSSDRPFVNQISASRDSGSFFFSRTLPYRKDLVLPTIIISNDPFHNRCFHFGKRTFRWRQSTMACERQKDNYCAHRSGKAARSSNRARKLFYRIDTALQLYNLSFI
ncbi:hypothetical protein PUN28_000059 [Cardiocondyla obscurior]|uniref:Uncharacterized protein n=1 Tax=Cardiocondyla obscurior TaxID=286306 RepID=A0AAW2GXI9_9HYME